MARIFLCHANEDKPQVEDLYNRLRDLGFEPWMDKKDLIPGQRWQQEIPRALKSSALVLICLSQNIGRPGFVQREFKLAVDALQEIPEEMIHTIPVRLESCNVPEPFTALHWCDLFEPDGFNRLEHAIRYGFEQRGLSVPDSPVTPPTSSGVSLSTPKLLPAFTNSIGMEFVFIPASDFMMGSMESVPDARRDEPAHQVTISQPFYLGKYPVTQAQWQVLMWRNRSDFKGADRPVENVSWKDAQSFMEKLNKREGLRFYRLPTEAEWEYACRAGSNTIYHFGDDAARLGEYAWYDENSNGQTHSVGQKKPNDWGLYDMHGNVWEWVQDWNGSYTADAVTDPLGPDTGAFRVLRGGCWGRPARGVRAAFRFWFVPGLRYRTFGFRCLSSESEPVSGAKGKP